MNPDVADAIPRLAEAGVLLVELRRRSERGILRLLQTAARRGSRGLGKAAP